MTTITSTEKIYRLFRKYRKICTDTRQLERDSIFIALHGEKFDGNTFAKQALEAGCSYAIVDNVKFAKGERCLLVEDCLQCLQSLANLYRRDMFIPFIGITGTNGKTTSKELINSVLSIRFRTFATKGNLNNHIGVPLTILSIPSNTEIAIIEMGASHVGEIANLCNICLPTHGLITNIGKAHLEGFGSFENIVNTKTALYRFIQKTHGKSFVNGDNALLMDKSKDLERFC
ncbi:MAG: Mur ligase family protein, partial [Bacteroidales bacterium]